MVLTGSLSAQSINEYVLGNVADRVFKKIVFEGKEGIVHVKTDKDNRIYGMTFETVFNDKQAAEIFHHRLEKRFNIPEVLDMGKFLYEEKTKKNTFRFYYRIGAGGSIILRVFLFDNELWMEHSDNVLNLN